MRPTTRHGAAWWASCVIGRVSCYRLTAVRAGRTFAGPAPTMPYYPYCPGSHHAPSTLRRRSTIGAGGWHNPGRGHCAVCGKDLALRSDDTARRHRDTRPTSLPPISWHAADHIPAQPER